MQGSLLGVRREGWALHNLFSLNLIKGEKRGREMSVGMWCMGGELLLHPFTASLLLWDSTELSSIIIPKYHHLCLQGGKQGGRGWMRLHSRSKRAGSETQGIYTFFHCFLFPHCSGEWDCWRAGEVKVSQGQAMTLCQQQHCLSSFFFKKRLKKPPLCCYR